MTSPASDTRVYTWLVEQGERETLTFPVLNEAGSPTVITGWTVDARIKDRPGGATLYTWPSNLAQITGGGSSVTLTIPGPVSAGWTWTTGWFRVKVTDPSSDPADPAVHRIIAGPLIISPD